MHTALETCGLADWETFRELVPHLDLFLYDIKHMDSERHYGLTGVRNETILSNLRLLLENRHNVRLRLPLLKGHNDGDNTMTALIRFLEPYREYRNFKGVDLLPYHKLGVHKYTQLGEEYPITGDPHPSNADLARIEDHFKRRDIPVAIIRH